MCRSLWRTFFCPKHVSRLCHPFPSPDFRSACFAFAEPRPRINTHGQTLKLAGKILATSQKSIAQMEQEFLFHPVVMVKVEYHRRSSFFMEKFELCMPFALKLVEPETLPEHPKTLLDYLTWGKRLTWKVITFRSKKPTRVTLKLKLYLMLFYSINHHFVIYIEDITWPHGDTNFIFKC